MNLLSQFEQIFNPVQQGFAKITGIKNDGTLIATTQAGATVLLSGSAEVGKNVFYDKVSRKVTDNAPDVVFREYGV